MNARYSKESLMSFATYVLEDAGIESEAAERIADIMVTADLQDEHSHGISMLPGLIGNIDKGEVAARPEYKWVMEQGAFALLDAGRGPGQWISWLALQKAMDIATNNSMAFVIAKNSSHWGRAGYYAREAARNNFVAFCFGNTIPNMIYKGTSVPSIGNNPFAFGCPGDKDREIVLDLASSEISWGRLGIMARQNEKIPSHWGLDKEGKPTEDPSDIMESRLLLPLGGAKGSGLAVMVEVMSGILGGGIHLGDYPENIEKNSAAGWSQSFLLFEPSAFAEKDELNRRIELMREALASNPKARGVEEILLPGDRSLKAEKESHQKGTSLPDHVIKRLEMLCVEMGIAMPGTLD